MDFKRKFLFTAQKCLRPPAITRNRELVDHFVWCLDARFTEALNSRLSLQGQLRVNALGRSHLEDPYTLEQVIQKAVDLVSSKTITKALQHSAEPVLRGEKIDLNSRAPVLFMKEEAVSGPVGQFQIPLRGYEVKTRRTRQSSLYELPSYLYKYMWLC